MRNESFVYQCEMFELAFDWAALHYDKLIKTLKHGSYVTFLQPNISAVRYNIRRTGRATVWDVEENSRAFAGEEDEEPLPAETSSCVIVRVEGPGTP